MCIITSDKLEVLVYIDEQRGVDRYCNSLDQRVIDKLYSEGLIDWWTYSNRTVWHLTDAGLEFINNGR